MSPSYERCRAILQFPGTPCRNKLPCSIVDNETHPDTQFPSTPAGLAALTRVRLAATIRVNVRETRVRAENQWKLTLGRT
jgi:hypothetical protein